MSKIVFHFYRVASDGSSEEFYRVTVESVLVTSVMILQPNTVEPENESVPIMQSIGFFYDTVEMESIVRTERLRYLRGDINNDIDVNLADGISLLNHLFFNGRISCAASGDANRDNALNIADVLYVLNFLFLNGPAIPSPFPQCAEASDSVGLSCEATVCSL